MAENFGIVVEIDPAKATQGIAAVEARLAALETSAKRHGDAVSRALASGFDGGKAARAQEQASSKAAREQARAAQQAARVQEREAKAAAAAQVKAAREAEREQTRAAKAAAAAQAKAARDATAAINAELARRANAEKAAATVGLPGAARGGRAAAAAGGVGGAVGSAAVGLVAGAVGVREIADMADAYTSLNNRLTTVTKSEDELARVRAELFAISNRTRTDISDTAQLYQTFGKAVLDTGKSHEEALQIIETVQQTVKLSGASAQAASAALVQLGQGMANNALRGEELNSIMEQTPSVADVLAKQLGVTRGELKKLGEQGVITRDQIVNAFEAQREEIEGKFAKTVPTLSEQFVVFKNELTKLIGEFNKNGDAAKLLGKVFSELLRGLRGIMEVAGWVRSAFEKVSGVFASLDNLVGGRLSKAFDFLGDQVRKLLVPFERLVQLKRLLFPDEHDTGAERAALETTSAELARRASAEESRPRITSESRDVDYGLVLQQLDRAMKLGEGARKKGEQAIKNATGQNILESEAKKAADAAKKLREEYERFANSVDPVGAAMRELADAEALVAKAQAAGVPGSEKALEHLARKKDLLRDQLDPYGAVTRAIEKEIALLAVDEQTRQRTTRLLAIENDLRGKGVELTEAQWKELDNLIRKEQEAAAAAEARVSAEEQRQRDSDLKYERAAAAQYAKEEFAKFNKAVKEDLGTVGKAAKGLEHDLKGALSSGFNSGLEALHDFVTEGKNSFKDLAQSLLKDISLIVAKMLLLKGVQAGLGAGLFGEGAAKTLTGLITGNFAAGGSFLVPGSGSTDSQTVAFRATPGERVTVSRPDQPGGAGASPNVNVPVQVVNMIDSGQIVDSLDTPAGHRLILNVIALNPGKVRGALQS